MSYASGKYALGICDRCGFTYKLHDLKEEVKNEAFTNIYTCPTCFDKDHPQLRVGREYIPDPQALYDARPDTGKLASRSIGSFNPVLGLTITVELGKVEIGSS